MGEKRVLCGGAERTVDDGKGEIAWGEREAQVLLQPDFPFWALVRYDWGVYWVCLNDTRLLCCVLWGTICSSDSAVYIEWSGVSKSDFSAGHRKVGRVIKIQMWVLWGCLFWVALTWEILDKSQLLEDHACSEEFFPPSKDINKKHLEIISWIWGCNKGFCLEENEENIWAFFFFWIWNQGLALFCI